MLTDMTSSYRKSVIVSLWVMCVVAIAIGIGSQSVAAWTTALAVAALPPMVMWYFWAEPVATMSEHIQEGRR